MAETYCAFGMTIASEIALPEIARVSARRRDVTIERTRSTPAAAEWFQTWRGKDPSGSRRRPWLSFGRTADGYLLRFPDLADFEVTSAGDRIRCRPRPRLAATTLRHLLLDQVLPLTLSRHGHLVLHASAVHVPGVGAVAFVGPTGSGKSTAAAALGMRGCPTITDDCLVIAGTEGHRTILPGYPGVRLWRRTALAMGLRAGRSVAHYTSKRRMSGRAVPFRDRPSPLRAVFALGRRVPRPEASRAIGVSPREQLMALAPYTYLMDIGDRDQLARTFRDLSCLVTEIPVKRLRLRDAGRKPQEMAAMAAEVLDFVIR